ncbi:MAG: helix-turn-helix domain-containing protein [Chloroflexi bacterium]|nr:helix-turn-helix domain-containing protein [Chloroflexota bacterium]
MPRQPKRQPPAKKAESAPRAKRPIDPTFGVNLDAVLSRTGAPSGRAVAQAAGIGETELSRIRQGKRAPSVMIARRIAEAVGEPLDELTKPLPTPASRAADDATQEVLKGAGVSTERRAQETQRPGGRRKYDPPLHS